MAAKTLGQLDCPVLHISGESHLFSCYDLGENVRSGGLTQKKIAGNGAVVLSNKVLETVLENRRFRLHHLHTYHSLTHLLCRD